MKAFPIDPLSLAGRGNDLLASLSAHDLQIVAKHGERRTFKLGEVVHRAGDQARHAFFVESGVASVIKVDGAGRKTEICLLGPESFFGAAIVLESDVPSFEVYSQANPLTVVAVPAHDVRALLAQSPVAAGLFSKAVYAQYLQIADNLESAVWQAVSARLARWLIMYRERIGSDQFEVTHAFMAIMIGAQRSKVTSALHDLEAQGAIASGRGIVRIRDVELLQTAALKGL